MIRLDHRDGSADPFPMSYMYDYELVRSRRRTISIEIDKEGRIKVRAPYNVSSLAVKRFVDEKSEWIERNVLKMKDRMAKLGEEDADIAETSTDELLESLAEDARRVIPHRVAYYAKIVGVDYGRITIRHQRTRWGSCSFKGNLNFNCYLMRAPEEILDYVIVHELCHRLEMNHSERFWKEVARVMPDYKERRKWLRVHGDELMKRRFDYGQ